MISLNDAYHTVEAIIPLYVAMILAYISVKWLKLFTPDQCSGINKFVAKFSIPLLSFQVISKSDPYKMNLKLVCADVLQKVIGLVGLAIITKVRSSGHLNWIITGISLLTLPNTLILGIPLLKAMYGDEAAVVLAQIVVLQSLIWYNFLLFLFELSIAREAHMVQTSEATGDWEAPQETQGISRISGRTKLMLVLLTVVKKLLMNPNSHATVVGLTWASISFGCDVKLPKVVENSITILSDGGLGMAMFSLGINICFIVISSKLSKLKEAEVRVPKLSYMYHLIGLFMASQTSIIACGTRLGLLAMVLKFIVGPAVMLMPSIAIGLKGVLFKTAVMQAALPQGIVPFVFAKEYNVHPDILSTGVIIGMLVALPITLVYYLLLGL